MPFWNAWSYRLTRLKPLTWPLLRGRSTESLSGDKSQTRGRKAESVTSAEIHAKVALPIRHYLHIRVISENV